LRIDSDRGATEAFSRADAWHIPQEVNMHLSIIDLREGVCEVTGKEGEVVVILTDDQTTPAQVSFKALQGMLRFEARQQAKRAESTPSK
jgi:hypothetical protein